MCWSKPNSKLLSKWLTSDFIFQVWANQIRFFISNLAYMYLDVIHISSLRMWPLSLVHFHIACCSIHFSICASQRGKNKHWWEQQRQWVSKRWGDLISNLMDMHGDVTKCQHIHVHWIWLLNKLRARQFHMGCQFYILNIITL